MASKILPPTGHAKGPGRNIILFFDASHSLKSCPIHWSCKETLSQTYHLHGEDRLAGQQYLKQQQQQPPQNHEVHREIMLNIFGK